MLHNYLQVELCAVLRGQRKYCLNGVGCGLSVGLITADWRGPVHNVAHKIIKGLKYKTFFHKSACKIHRKFYFVSTQFSAIIKYCSLRNITIFQGRCQHKNYISLFTVTFTLYTRYPTTWSVWKPIFCEIFYYNIY